MNKVSLVGAILLVATTFAIADHEKLQSFAKIFNDLHKDPQGPPSQSLSREDKDVKTLWIEQKLDHFNNNESRIWQMRYMANDKFYRPGGPLFIYVGGEWSISRDAISEGRHIYDMAREHNGYLFYTEHRFYGESWPVEDMTNENMKYLDVQQALADLAHFIRTMKATIPGMENSKAILAGGSYSATMVTWFKVLYPDLAVGCWASSAPLRAKADYIEYKEIMGNSIKLLTGDTCHDRINNGFAELESMFANKRGAEVKAMLKLCSPFDEDNDMDISTLFYEISELFARLVQTHNNDEIQRDCSIIMEGSSDVIGLANYIAHKFGTSGCTDFSYSSYLSLFKNSTFSGKMMRAWTYQTCNEFGWFQTSRSRYQPFGTKYPLDFFTTLCADAYGDHYTKEYIGNRIKETNKIFGGLKPKVENVYWTHGQLDPWRAAGIQEAKKAVIIPYHAHCKDFYSISPKDSAELRTSKETIAALVSKWLLE